MPASRSNLPPAFLLALLCAGCAGTAENGYPSLAIRDVERIEGSMQAPAATVFVPAAPAPATLARLEDLRAEAEATHRAFLATTQSARPVIRAGANAATGSENWARAQVALADLETIRSDAMIALADLDRIYVDAATDGDALDRIAVARAAVIALVDEENDVVAELSAMLR